MDDDVRPDDIDTLSDIERDAFRSVCRRLESLEAAVFPTPAAEPAGDVCPECWCAPPFHKGSCSRPGEQLVDPIAEIARLTRELAAERELRRQDDARLVAAAEKAGIPPGGSDTPDDLAEALLCEKAAKEKAERDRAEAARLRPLEEAVRLWREAVKRSLAGEDDAEVDGEDGVMRALSHLERVYDALDAAGEATP